MKVLVIGGLILGTTALLLLLRSLLVKGTSTPNQQWVYLMRFSDGGDEKQDSNDEWPSLIGTEESDVFNVRELSEDERIQVVITEEQILRLIR